MCERSGRGKSTEPTGKFSPAARAAMSASSPDPFLRESPRGAPTERRGRLTDARGRGQGQFGGREAAVTGVDSRDGAIVVSLPGEGAPSTTQEGGGALLAGAARGG